MAPEPLHLFDPRRNFQTQGFTGRAATTTLHDASATGVSISGIFQAAEDFAVLGLYNAYDYFAHLRTKHLPRTDLSGLKLEFEIEYDQALDGCMRLDAAKYPSVSWDAMTFVTGARDIHDVRLLDHATVVSGGETPASLVLHIAGSADGGVDWLHLYFRDSRYTVASSDVGTLSADALVAKFVEIINTSGDPVSGRVGPDQSGVIVAGAEANGTLRLTFVSASGTTARYGKLGNLDRVYVAHGRTGGTAQGFQWQEGNGAGVRFTGGDNDTKYRISLDFAAPLLDKSGAVVPMNDCRKIYMVFAPRFEPAEQNLEDGAFLTAAVGAGDTVWSVDSVAGLTGGRYFIGDGTDEERVVLLATAPGQITVQRGAEGTTARAWPLGTRVTKLSSVTGFTSDVEWGCTISNIAVTGDSALKVGGDAERIEESDKRCVFAGYWEEYSYGGGFPTQWWSGGHARRAAPADAGDVRCVTITYSRPVVHDLYLGTFLNTDCGKVRVAVDGVEVASSLFDLYLNEYGGTVANLKLASGVAAGVHTVVITALFEKNAASSGYYFYFDYLWPLVPVDVPDAPEEYPGVSLAIDFDTDHGYKKPPAWHVWQLQKLGFKGHADVYMGVFWNNKRRRVGATYPYATVAFSGTPAPGDVVSISIGGTTLTHAIGYGETLQVIVSQMRAAMNGMFSGVWADDNYGTSTTLAIRSKAPGYTFTGVSVSAPNSVTLTLSDQLGAAGAAGDWELIDSVSPVLTEGARLWIRDLAGQFAAAGIPASFAFSMECYNPPAEMRAKYLRLDGGVAAPGEDVYLDVPSHQMHFGSRVRQYLRQMYKECADEIAAGGLPVVLQFGETQWWYFGSRATDPDGGMPFYDQETLDAFAAKYGHPIWPFRANTDDPSGDPAHPYETADFLRDRIWEYCADVISYVQRFHPTAVFECLWPLDANQGKPAPTADFRALNFHVNLPEQWKNSSYGVKYFRCEGFDYDIWQKNSTLMDATLRFAIDVLGRPAEECMYLAGLYGPPDPPIAQAYGNWKRTSVYSLAFWAFDQFCLNSRPVPLVAAGLAGGNRASYHKPRAARAMPKVQAVVHVPTASGKLNTFRSNTRGLNE